MYMAKNVGDKISSVASHHVTPMYSFTLSAPSAGRKENEGEKDEEEDEKEEEEEEAALLLTMEICFNNSGDHV